MINRLTTLIAVVSGSEPPIGQARGDVKESLGGEPWFATFSLFDAGCAMSSSQLQHLVASIAKLWRRTIGRLV